MSFAEPGAEEGAQGPPLPILQPALEAWAQLSFWSRMRAGEKPSSTHCSPRLSGGGGHVLKA